MVTHATRVMLKDSMVVAGIPVTLLRKQVSGPISSMTFDFSGHNVTTAILTAAAKGRSSIEICLKLRDQNTLIGYMPTDLLPSKPTTTTRKSSQSTKK